MSDLPSARQVELLEAAYRYVLDHGLADLSLRPLAAAIGSSPRVLMFLFGSKDGLVRALLARARADELTALDEPASLDDAVVQVWTWLRAPGRRSLLRLWAEAYARSLVDPDGSWGGFAQATVDDWLTLLAAAQPSDERDTPTGLARRTLALATLRGCLLDLLATGDDVRIESALRLSLRA